MSPAMTSSNILSLFLMRILPATTGVAELGACMSDPGGTTRVMDQEGRSCRGPESSGACRVAGRFDPGYSPDVTNNRTGSEGVRPCPCCPFRPYVQGAQKRRGTRPG